MTTKNKLGKKDLEYFKQKLLLIREKLAGDIHHLEEGSLHKSPKDAAGDLSGYSFHMADVATESFETEVSIGLTSSSKNVLNEVDDALKRIEDGTYGICERYQTLIPRPRLEVMPYTRYSIQAQQEIENERKQM
jgi:DnaK suppressor protein